jgi:hypothetical protein
MSERLTDTIDLGEGYSAVIYAKWLAGEEDDYNDWMSQNVIFEGEEPKGLPPTGSMGRELVRIMLVKYVTPEGDQPPTNDVLRAMPIEHRERLTAEINKRRPLAGGRRGKT